jgi:hypothetical protein
MSNLEDKEVYAAKCPSCHKQEIGALQANVRIVSEDPLAAMCREHEAEGLEIN